MTDPGRPIHLVRPARLAAFYEALSEGSQPAAAFLRGQDFTATAQSLVLLPRANSAADIHANSMADSPVDGVAAAVLGLGEDTSPFALGGLAWRLPEGAWHFAPGTLAAAGFSADDAALGFLLGAYVYDRLKPSKRAPARLADEVSPYAAALAAAINQARDLINTPPNLLGPAELAAAAAAVGVACGAAVERVQGAALAARFPLLAAVGAGSARAPEAVVWSWAGTRASPTSPLISLCGKGVCFDTGGYDLKPSAAMLRMKKDMGGAAIVLGLAQAVTALDLPVRLEVRIGCAENSISGSAMRPSDVLTSKTGLTVEIGNTDAEGRLVLCDLLAEAAAQRPHWLIDIATLTGAARVALGPDIPALFCNDEPMAAALLAAGLVAHDPLWRLPLWPGYAGWLDSPIADTNTVSAKPMAGAIIAALFLQRFVPPGISWAHIDTYAWNDQPRPGRPEGGEAQTLRALLGAIRKSAQLAVR